MDKNKSVRFFSQEFRLLHEEDDVTVIYNRRWHTYGKFEMHFASDMPCLKIDNLVMFDRDKRKNGIIKYINITDDGVVVRGYSLLWMLTNRITVPDPGMAYMTFHAPVEDIMVGMVRKNAVDCVDPKRNFAGWECEVSGGRGEKIRYQTRYGNLMEELEELSRFSLLGVSVRMEPENKKCVFEVLQGMDKSILQQERPPVIFRKSYDNIQSTEYTLDDSDTKTCAYTAGQGEGADRAVYIVGDNLSGADRKEIYVDARDIEDNAELPTRGQSRLAGNVRKESYEAVVFGDWYQSRWDMGDTVTVIDDETGIMLTHYVSEVEETLEDGVYEVLPTFGVAVSGKSTGGQATDGTTPSIGDNGNWYLGGYDTGKPSQGIPGTDGRNGVDGTNGITPTIGSNGNWYLGDIDTGKPSRGEKGEKGEIGDDGPIGPPGPKGDTGAAGPQGLKGETGAVGPQGPKGDTGAIGPQGLKGDTGATGPQGLKGDKGDTGSTGPQGPQGLKGDTGATGPQGPQGIKGDKGDAGPQGEKGATGATGPQGPKGDTGTAGTRGSKWYCGTGITGTSTTAAVFSGSGVSSALVDDMYLHTTTGHVYRCTVAGAASVAKWAYVGSIKGAAGAKGDTGATGPQGPQGATGAKGATGATGPQGPAGAKGEAGTRGSQWYSGTAITGTSTTATVFSGSGITFALVGDYYLHTTTGYVYRCTVAGAASVARWVYSGSIKGATGPQGPKGDTGARGPAGPQGAQGPKGDNSGVIYQKTQPSGHVNGRIWLKIK